MSKLLLDLTKILPWKQQSNFRGPDLPFSANLKKITRWLREITQHTTDPSHSYMQKQKLPTVDEVWKEFEFTTIYHARNLLFAMEIIGYKHPNKQVSKQAQYYYFGLVNFLHLNSETEEELDKRLKDIVIKW